MTLIPAVLRDGTNSLTLNWDFENKLTTADVGSDTTIDVTYKWDALGRRVYRDDGPSPRVFVQVGQQTIADYDAGIAASTPKYRYVYASYIDEPVLRTLDIIITCCGPHKPQSLPQPEPHRSILYATTGACLRRAMIKTSPRPQKLSVSPLPRRGSR